MSVGKSKSNSEIAIPVFAVFLAVVVLVIISAVSYYSVRAKTVIDLRNSTNSTYGRETTVEEDLKKAVVGSPDKDIKDLEKSASSL